MCELIFCNCFMGGMVTYISLIDWMPPWGSAVILHGMYAEEPEFKQLGSCNLKLQLHSDS